MTRSYAELAVTGWSLHLPGADIAAAAVQAGDRSPGGWAESVRAASCPPERAADRLGRRGMLYKEPATRLALCAVHRALGLPAGERPSGPPDPGTAVVAASNLGNVATVAGVARTVAAEGGRAVSPLAAPNASSNVVASTVGLWFRFGGPNLMVCSGATAGLDALWLAGLLLTAGRADRVVVVGAEPDDDVATALYATAGTGVRLRAGAACVVLGRPGVAAEVSAAMSDGPEPGDVPTIGPGGLDLATLWGDCYGAQGVVATALAAYLATGDGPDRLGIRCGSAEDGWRTARVTATGRRPAPAAGPGAVAAGRPA
jgi:3-oxoacyl-[acyl-carrier-protein] synthase II